MDASPRIRSDTGRKQSDIKSRANFQRLRSFAVQIRRTRIPICNLPERRVIGECTIRKICNLSVSEMGEGLCYSLAKIVSIATTHNSSKRSLEVLKSYPGTLRLFMSPCEALTGAPDSKQCVISGGALPDGSRLGQGRSLLTRQRGPSLLRPSFL